jgi:hypothetical protein
VAACMLFNSSDFNLIFFVLQNYNTTISIYPDNEWELENKKGAVAPS